MARLLSKLSITVAVGIFLLFGALFVSFAGAQSSEVQVSGDAAPIRTEVVIPGSQVEATAEGAVKTVVSGLAGYIENIYNFLISIVGLLAGVMLMVGGYQYLTSGGNAERARAARKRIGDALIGMALALGSFFILNTINPDLIRFESIETKIAAVKTELSFLPWCEDQIKEGLNVKQIPGSGSGCGSIGEFVPKKIEDENKATEQISYCVYRGDKLGTLEITYDGDKTFYGTRHAVLCFQGGWDAKKLKEQAEKLKKNEIKHSSVKFASKTACKDLNPGNSGLLRSLGYFSVTDNVCDKWLAHSKAFTDPQEKPKRAAWCGFSDRYLSCVETVIDCKKTNENRPDEPINLPSSCINITNPDLFCENADDCRKLYDSDSQCVKDLDKGYRCKGYEEEPEPWWVPPDADTGYEYQSACPQTLAQKYLSECGDPDLDDFSGILEQVCEWNPCKFNLDRGGCSFGGTPSIPILRSTNADCENK